MGEAGGGGGAAPFLWIFEKDLDRPHFFIQFEKRDGLEEILDRVNHMGGYFNKGHCVLYKPSKLCNLSS